MSSKVFDRYAAYYDLLYRDKDYAGEAEFVRATIRSQCPSARSMLELGCGTGVHARLLARDFEVFGIDFSESMVERANQERLPNTTFEVGDVRTLEIAKRFDAVVSLFHVVSYQTTNDDVSAMFATMKRHLAPGGVCLFDCWYGPAVLTTLPSVRAKRLADDKIELIRIAEPLIDFQANTVDVNYQVLIRARGERTWEEVRETHKMRYLFLPEIEFLCEKHGLKLLRSGEWLTDKPLSKDSWGAYFVLTHR